MPANNLANERCCYAEWPAANALCSDSVRKHQQGLTSAAHPSGTVWLTGDVAALTGGGGTLSLSRPGLMGRGPGLVARGLRGGVTSVRLPSSPSMSSAAPHTALKHLQSSSSTLFSCQRKLSYAKLFGRTRSTCLQVSIDTVELQRLRVCNSECAKALSELQTEGESRCVVVPDCSAPGCAALAVCDKPLSPTTRRGSTVSISGRGIGPPSGAPECAARVGRCASGAPLPSPPSDRNMAAGEAVGEVIDAAAAAAAGHAKSAGAPPLLPPGLRPAVGEDLSGLAGGRAASLWRWRFSDGLLDLRL